MEQQEILAYIAEWRRMEDRFYRAILNSPEPYMLGIRLVRAVADSLAPLKTLDALVSHFERCSSETVVPIADALDAPQVALLDYQLALGAAFYLRSQEIMGQQSLHEVQARIATARAQSQPWVVIYDHETRRNGQTFFTRLELRLADGLGLLTASELDWERGRVFVVEPLLLEPTTGEPRRGVTPPAPRQEFTTREAMQQAIEELRRRNP